MKRDVRSPRIPFAPTVLAGILLVMCAMLLILAQPAHAQNRTIDSVSPATAERPDEREAERRLAVTINGSGFQSGDFVNIYRTPDESSYESLWVSGVFVDSDTQITAVVDLNHCQGLGQYVVEVYDADFDDSTTLENAFEVTGEVADCPPVEITDVSPSSGDRATTIENLRITGSNLQAAHSLSFENADDFGSTSLSIAGFTVNPVGTQLTTDFYVPSSATPGSYDAIIKDRNGFVRGTLADAFEITNTPIPDDGAPPQVESTNPTDGETDVSPFRNVAAFFSEPVDESTINADTFTVREEGSSQDLAGNSFYYTEDTDGTISANLFPDCEDLDGSCQLATNTTYTATIKGGESGVKDLFGNPVTEDYSWTFTTGEDDGFGGTDDPFIASFSPESVDPGENVEMTINGSGFQSGAVVELFIYNSITTGTTITASSAVVSDGGTRITADFDTLANAPAGKYDLYVSNPDGGFAYGFEPFTIGQPPEMASISPTKANPGETFEATINGEDFQNDATVALYSLFDEETIEANSVAVSTGGAQLTATFDIPSDATHNQYYAYITNPDGGFSFLSDAVTIGDLPNIETVAPASGGRGTTVEMTIEGSNLQNTGFVNLGNDDSGSYLETDEVEVNQQGTVATASLFIATTATPGDSYTVRLSDRGFGSYSNTLHDAFEVTDAPVPDNGEAPRVVASDPEEGAIGFPPDSYEIGAFFSEPLNPSTLNDGAFFLMKEGETEPVSGLLHNYEERGNGDIKAFLQPDYSEEFAYALGLGLEPETTYTATVKGGANGVKDFHGNPLAGDFTWTFTTGAASTGGEGEISGTVFENSADAGNGLDGALVEVCGGLGGCGFTSTNASGEYTVGGLADDTYDIRAFPPSFSNLNLGGIGSVELSNGESLTGQDIVLTAPTPPPGGTSINDTPPGEIPTVFAGEPVRLETTGCSGGTATYEVTSEYGESISGAMAEEPDGTYTANFSIPFVGSAVVATTIDCPEGEDETTEFDIYIDPSGNVLTVEGDPIEGATATLFRSDDEAGPFEIVPDGSAIMSPSNRTNPDTTDATGHFGWDTIPGFYKVRAEKDGCVSPGDPNQTFVETEALPVPPEQLGLELRLDCPTNEAPAAEDDSYEIRQDGILEVDAPGVLANDSDPDGDPLAAELVDGVENGSLALESDGSFTYNPDNAFSGDDTFTYVAKDGASESDPATITIAVAPLPAGTPQICRNDDAIVGTDGNNALVGTPGRDIICGLGGNDTIRGLGGNDLVLGGDGNDVIFGGVGNDNIQGGVGNDRLVGEAGNDTLLGLGGVDRISGQAGNDLLQGGAGGDFLYAGPGNDRLFGQGGNDLLNAIDRLPGDIANGGSGNDRCVSDRGDSRVGCER